MSTLRSLRSERTGARLPVRAGLMSAALLTTLALAAGCQAPPPRLDAYIGRSEWTYDQDGIIRGDRTQRRLALVFTGGEHGEGTATILDALQRHGARASFFVTGQYLADRGRQDLVRRMVREGHYVGPHSDGHLLYCAWEKRAQSLVTHDQFRDDLRRNIKALRKLGALRDNAPIFFVPPYEWYNQQHVAWARELGVVVVNFTPGTGSNRDYIPEGDRGFVPSRRIRSDILAFEDREPQGLNGFLLLLHLGSTRQDKMHHQVDALLDELVRRGYALVRVDELLQPTAP